MRRVVLKSLLAAAWTASLPGQVTQAATGPKLGVLMLHGKSPGSSRDPHFGSLRPRLEAQGWLVLMPDMPWSRTRYLEGHWDGAMLEITAHVQSLRDQGAERVVLIGHSMGCPAAMGFAARGGRADALVLLAPGHIPYGYYHYPTLKAVHDSIDEARALVAAGKGDTRQNFVDINQGRRQTLLASARDYLSFFDPDSDADMGVTAPRLPASLPVLTAIGEEDPLFANVRAYFVDKLPANPRSRFLAVKGGHLDTPKIAADALIAWMQEL